MKVIQDNSLIKKSFLNLGHIMSNISIVIPCYPPHIKYLKNILLEISAQTLLPIEVILAISETDDAQKIELRKSHKIFLNKKIKLRIRNSKYKKLAGINRNRGASVANGTYVMFIDADDSIHPMKIEITKYFLDKYDVNLFLHSFVINKPADYMKNYTVKYLTADVIDNDNLLHGTFGNPPVRDRDAEIHVYKSRGLYTTPIPKKYRIHHAYITIKKTLLSKHTFLNIKTGEDSIFDRDILWNEGKVLFVNVPLVNYYYDKNKYKTKHNESIDINKSKINNQKKNNLSLQKTNIVATNNDNDKIINTSNISDVVANNNIIINQVAEPINIIVDPPIETSDNIPMEISNIMVNKIIDGVVDSILNKNNNDMIDKIISGVIDKICSDTPN